MRTLYLSALTCCGFNLWVLIESAQPSMFSGILVSFALFVVYIHLKDQHALGDGQGIFTLIIAVIVNLFLSPFAVHLFRSCG